MHLAAALFLLGFVAPTLREMRSIEGLYACWLLFGAPERTPRSFVGESRHRGLLGLAINVPDRDIAIGSGGINAPVG
eukprot:s1469_g2.t1